MLWWINPVFVPVVNIAETAGRYFHHVASPHLRSPQV